MTLSERIRNLHSGYQGLDDQAAIAREVGALEVQVDKVTRLLARELIEDDGLGSEYIYVNALKEELKVERELNRRLANHNADLHNKLEAKVPMPDFTCGNCERYRQGGSNQCSKCGSYGVFITAGGKGYPGPSGNSGG